MTIRAENQASKWFEQCDVCGDWVNLRDDPIFKNHNEMMYIRHVCLSHKFEDAVRIIKSRDDYVIGEQVYELMKDLTSVQPAGRSYEPFS